MRLSLGQIMSALEQRTFSAYVLYGSNTPLIQGILQEINASFPYETIEMRDLSAYREDLETPLLFGHKPYAVHVEGVINWPKIGPILSAWPRNHAILVHAPSIPLPWSKKSEIAILPCYDCSLEESKRMVSRALMREKIHLDPQALRLCAELTQSGQWHSILSVLSLASEDNGSINPNDLHQLFPETWGETGLSILDAAGSTFLQDPIVEPLQVIRSWQRIMLQLYQYQHFLPNLGPDGALEAIRPHVFFKYKVPLTQAAVSWSKMRVIRCLGQLIQGEIAIKKNMDQASRVLNQLLRHR